MDTVIDLTADSPPRRSAAESRPRRRSTDGKRRRVGGGASPSPQRRRLAAPHGPCELCGKSVALDALLRHQAACGDESRAAAAATHSDSSLERCTWCRVRIPLAQLGQHAGACAQMPGRFKDGALPLALVAACAEDTLTKAQAAALEHVSGRTRAASTAALPALRAHAAALGYSERELQARRRRARARAPRCARALTPRAAQDCLAYIRVSAPLVIHLDAATKLTLLLADTHYRNQFETATSGGTLDANARCAPLDCCAQLASACR